VATDPKVIAVAMAIKQSFEQNAGAGSSINSHPNAFFLNVNGAVDLYKAAEVALKRAESYEENFKAQFEANVRAFYDKLDAEIKSGAVSIQDAIARIKTKAGGELLAAEGIVDEAIARTKGTGGAGRHPEPSEPVVQL
jgi:hypothetical protein